MGRIAIQGYEGSFHEVAARLFCGDNIEVITCNTFRDLVHVAESSDECSGAVMAIENSIAGSILPNYNLLQQSGLHITGEIYLQVSQNLLVNPGVTLKDIREVHSHTMALQQCYDFLDLHKWKLVETDDTALSAKHIRQHHSIHTAAIASKLAAKIYGLDILVPDIQTLRNNYTRFLVLQKPGSALQVDHPNKASLNFHTDHSKGSLAKVLTHVAELGINLSKLQSFPIPGTEFKYSFHADMEFDSLKQFEKMLTGLGKMTEALRVYGAYQKGKLFLDC